ncbi:aminotransferase class I/II-fold pyridoxal phosphate-dependent enzyme [Mycobacterium intracellulare]|uniref:Putative Orn/Lys/Arg decarboxylase n=1 Tax=Mycobacterium intracellulare (strain ATCC 13950 / DSM 43223 / JCM 6384 / NCTC 13025 / 3600) TaxID=487521 RepID=H8ITA9_MYCIA|nr:aminotransferase class I/II-fold pyridoxal phosphate-dependent enzyme [Mycobacterium intracellulare]AFC44460.1 putative Orn/Lys/Arg decarboxylase [Mycobacterium intracellulare ATCC 13950]MEE3804033.1 aminotransferase class I/II-fold pyridoxal phosphate-dependent enzyme [Mycobacterium intracellulare]OBG14857.1 amino acid decarboxylase [Mycobacterium intracellulare]PBA30801.1 amino acid decarboxylase [Mycobacterium intracellulare]UQB89106.1 aminotransferase class I/II-fold pyridoxal phosphate
MIRYSTQPRRLRVSALAAVANPSYARVDTWNLLDDACRHLAEVDLAGLDKTHDVARVKRLMDRIAAYERYWLYPGAENLAVFRAHLESLSTVRLTEEVSLAVRLLSEYGDRAGLFDTSAPLDDQELVAQAKQQHFYTVLLADDAPSTAPDSLAECLRALRCPSDDVQFEILVVPSVEDAITAVALNGEIQAAIIRDDLPLRSRDRLPLMNTLLGPNEDADGVIPDRANDWVECGEWIRELRPHIDLYLLTDESIAAGDDSEPDVYDRTFYRLNDVTDLHSTVLAGLRNRYATPFFDALRAYAAAPVGQFHALPVARGASIFNSRSLQDMGEFYGRNIFMAETSTTSGGLDSLLDPHGNIKKAMDKAAKTWNADHTYFVTNGTSTANKIVVQSLTRPGDIVLIDRNCHKSHHYGLVLAGAYPLYLDAYPLPQFAIYGAVSLRTIKQTLLDLEAAGQLDRVRMLLLTNCTFDGVVYNPLQVMQEVLAIKPDICFLWDEAWYAFATAVPWARQRTAMVAAERLEHMLASPEYVEEYRKWAASMDGVDRSEWIERELMPDPASARVRVYATHSTHKSLSALRQASMIHVRDEDFNALTRDAFGEAFLTHTSTSPNQQLLASLDLARRQVDIEGFQLVRQVYDMALVFRHRVRKDRLISKWFRILDESDLVPEEFRESSVSSYREVRQGALAEWNEAWRSDQFVLDATRVTLFVGATGMNGYDFREKILMERFGIQINKTSINSVLLIFTIGVTWSSVHYLLDVLRRVAIDFDRTEKAASVADRALQQRHVEEITEDLPHLPDFSEFDVAFRPVDECNFGDMRSAFYAGYEEADREHVLIGMAGRRLAEGKTLVSTTFVVPYPPGFPVLVPGQVVSKEIVYFLAQLDVKEIHGYNPDLGLSVFTETALARMEAQRNAAAAAVGSVTAAFELPADASGMNGARNGAPAVPSVADNT